MFSSLLKNHYYILKTFRKNFTTDMNSMGMTIQEVQALLDRKDLSTTLSYYANVNAEKLKEKIDKLQMLSAYDNIDMKKPGKTLIPGKKERNFRGVAQPG